MSQTEKNRYKRLLRRLEPQQRRFVREYLKDCNGTDAAIRSGYSAKTARQQASRLLRKAEIKAAIAAAQRLNEALEWEIEAGKRKRLEVAAFASITDFFDARGQLLPSEQWPPGAEDAVKAISTRTARDGSTVTQLKLTDRVKPLARLRTMLAARDKLALSPKDQTSRMTDEELDVFLYSLVMPLFLDAGWRIKTREGMEFKLDILAEQLMKALKLKDPAE